MSSAAEATPQVHRLFFAIRPDAAAAAVAAQLTEQAVAAHGLGGRPVEAERLHVTLHWLHDHPGVPSAMIAAATQAGDAIEAGPFGVGFDRLESFGDARRGGPLVLSGQAGLGPLRRFQRELAAAMVDAGIGACARGGFRPHMTLLYERTRVAAQAVEPVRWTVDELLLVDSLLGRHRHVVLARWPLARSRDGRPRRECRPG